MNVAARAWKVTQGGDARTALASVTVAEVIWTNAYCPPPCNGRVMSRMGATMIETYRRERFPQRLRGRVVTCPRCGSLVEVIEHG